MFLTVFVEVWQDSDKLRNNIFSEFLLEHFYWLGFSAPLLITIRLEVPTVPESIGIFIKLTMYQEKIELII
jgi:hypothetical protein